MRKIIYCSEEVYHRGHYRITTFSIGARLIILMLATQVRFLKKGQVTFLKLCMLMQLMCAWH